MCDRQVQDPAQEMWAKMMRAANAGDEAAYRTLLEDISRSVRAMARSALARARVGDGEVEDIVQETLLAIHLKRQTWESGARLAPWVFAIARHKIVDVMRRSGARRYEPIEDFEEFLAAPKEADPHDYGDAERLMRQLAPRQRDIVRAISFEEQSIAATAKRFSMSEGAVRVAFHRALKSLAAAWRSSSSQRQLSPAAGRSRSFRDYGGQSRRVQVARAAT
jgi:RNA polymerase sigma-70 factor (ECF subfamily)